MNASRRHVRYASPALALTMIAGCASQKVADVQQQPREQITYAATARYPGNAQSSDKVQAVALDAPDDHQFIIYNLADATIPASTVWVNGSFVRQIDGIGPKGHLALSYGNLIQAGPGTSDLRQSGQPVKRVELQTPDGLYKVQGPGMK